MSDDRKPPGDSYRPIDEDDDEHERKRLFERAVPEVIKRIIERAVETGVEKISEGPKNIRHLIDGLELPKEAAQYFYGQIDDTKKGVYRVVAKEIRDVLEHTNFSDEIADVLTKLSFEINTTIRFVPNPANPAEVKEGEEPAEPTSDEEPKRPSKIPKPTVVSKVVMKAVDAAHEGLDRIDPRARKGGGES